MRRYTCIGFICCFVILCLLAVTFPAISQAKVIKLKYADFFPPTHAISVVDAEWCKEVEKRTDGRVKISYLPGGTLLKGGPPSYEGIVRGIADVGISSQQWLAGRFPLSEVLYLPMGASSATQVVNMANEWLAKFKPKEYDDVKVMYLCAAPPGVIMTLKPLPSIYDLKGLKIRAAGSTSLIVEAMEAVPVSVPIGDIYEGLQRGMIEGVCFPAEALKGWRFGDLIRGMQDNAGIGYPSGQVIAMNKKKWDSLPADIQKIIEQINKEWIAKVGPVFDATTKEGIDFAVAKGMKVFKISPEEVAVTKQRMQVILDNYVKKMNELGLPGEESLKFCLDYIKAHPDE